VELSISTFHLPLYFIPDTAHVREAILRRRRQVAVHVRKAVNSCASTREIEHFGAKKGGPALNLKRTQSRYFEDTYRMKRSETRFEYLHHCLTVLAAPTVQYGRGHLSGGYSLITDQSHLQEPEVAVPIPLHSPHTIPSYAYALAQALSTSWIHSTATVQSCPVRTVSAMHDPRPRFPMRQSGLSCPSALHGACLEVIPGPL